MSMGLAYAHEHWKEKEITGLRFPDGRRVRAHNQMPSGEEGFCLGIDAYSEPAEMGVTVWFHVRIDFADDWHVNGSYVERVEISPHPIEYNT